jgi:hypothetical protein
LSKTHKHLKRKKEHRLSDSVSGPVVVAGYSKCNSAGQTNFKKNLSQSNIWAASEEPYQ